MPNKTVNRSGGWRVYTNQRSLAAARLPLAFVVRGLCNVGSVFEMLSFGFTAVVVALVCWCAYIFVEGTYYQGILGPALERDLGFHEGAAYLCVGRRTHSAVAIKTIVEDGIFAKAGFVAGDVLPGLSHTDLFKRLHRHRGRVVEFTVVDGGEGPPFYERPKRVLKFAVPVRRNTE